MIYPRTFENKIGFDAVRRHIRELCLSQLGREKCDAMTFRHDYDMVKTDLMRVDEMMKILSADNGFTLAGLDDVTSVLNAVRVIGTHAPASDLLRLRRTLDTAAAVRAFFASQRNDEEESSPYPSLDSLCSGLGMFDRIVREIDRIIDRHGAIKDNASPELASIRRELASMASVVTRVMRKVMAEAVREGYLEADATPAVRDGRPVIPVSPMHKRKIRGIVHDESASGKTVYIEPAEVVEVSNRVRELQIAEQHEQLRILTLFADFLRPDIDDILATLAIMADVDFIHAKALFAGMVDARMPVIEKRPEIDWYHACHPILKLSLEKQGGAIVPLDITLTPQRRILVISGPNAGGKSVALKTTAIVQYMAQCGVMPTIYENSHLGIMRSIFIDIGDDQSIEDDLSTYSSHLRNMKYFLQHADNRTLILIDELGGGTEPQIGGAIAQAVLQQLNKQKAWGVVTTHFQNLKQFADHTPGLVNGSMLYDRQLMQPLFSLSIGSPGSSFAIEIARKTGLPDSIIQAATEIVGSDYVNLDKYLLDIARDKRYWENKRNAIHQRERQLDNIIQNYTDDAERLRLKRKEILDEARTKADKIIAESNASVERTIREIRSAQADKERTLEARRKLAAARASLNSADNADTIDSHPLLDAARKKGKKPRKLVQDSASAPGSRPSALAVGMNVLLDGKGSPGVIEEISGDTATAVFGMLRTRVKLSRLTPTLRSPSSPSKKSSFLSVSSGEDIRNRQLNFKQEIDVRGMRADEAVQAVTYFIDDAIQFSAGRVRILHGTGTGALRQYIRAYLSTVSGVKNYHDEDVRFGGAGITVVELD